QIAKVHKACWLVRNHDVPSFRTMKQLGKLATARGCGQRPAPARHIAPVRKDRVSLGCTFLISACTPCGGSLFQRLASAAQKRCTQWSLGSLFAQKLSQLAMDLCYVACACHVVRRHPNACLDLQQSHKPGPL